MHWNVSIFRLAAVLCCLCFVFADNVNSEKPKEDAKPKKKKDIRDYTDADMERLYDQWELNDEDLLEPDELPEHMRPRPKFKTAELFKDTNDFTDTEKLLKLSKKGQTLMIFVTVSGKPTQRELEDITAIWQSALSNAHMDTSRFVVDEKRVIFMFKDGALAWDAKDFLVKQERCVQVSIDGRDYAGVAWRENPALAVPSGQGEKVKREL